MSNTNYMNDVMQDILKHSAQSSAAWDKLRLGKFTASKVWQLMSDPKLKADKEAGKFSDTGEKYIIERAMEESTGMPCDEAFGRAIDHGNEWEETALLALRDQLNAKMELKPAFGLFNEHSGASPDAFIYLDDGTRIGVEMKCPFNSINHFWHSQVDCAEKLKEIDKTYYWQVLMNCLTFKCTTWIFASFDPRMPEDKRLHFCYIEPCIDDLTELCKRIERAADMKQQIVNQFSI